MIFDDSLGSVGVDAPTMRRRAMSVATRLLGGSGRAGLFAFRAQPQRSIEVLAHGICPDGTFVVAASVGDVEVDAAAPAPLDVRLDVEKDAPEATLRIRAATLHALGRLAWVDEASLRPDDLPGMVAGLHGLPGVRVGTVEIEKVLLHDCAGIIPLSWAEVRREGPQEPFPQLLEELSAAEIVSALGTAQWVEIIHGVLTGRLAGEEIARRELPSPWPHAHGTVRCVDVDANGVTVMHLTSTDATTVFVPFPGPATSLGDVRGAVAGFLRLGSQAVA